MITAYYASLLGLMLIGLSANIIRFRGKLRVGLDNADNMEMERRIRAQTNLV